MAKQQKLTNGKRDWSDLPFDLVYLIAKKLPDLLDIVHVHFACKSWCSATPLSDFTLVFPWLLEFRKEPTKFISKPTRKLYLYSMLSGKTLTVDVKESMWFRGLANNYLPSIDHHTGAMSLFNPLTKDEFVVPFIYDPSRIGSMFVWREPGPIRDRSILITNHHKYHNSVSRWVVDDPHHGRWIEKGPFCKKASYCQGMYFSSGNRAGFPTKVVDVSSNKMLYKIPPHEGEITDAILPGEQLDYIQFYRSYLVDTIGEILRVHWYYTKETLRKSKFLIYRLKLEGVIRDQPRWVKIGDIGDQMLFLEVVRNGFQNKTYGFSMTAAPANGLRGGSIYFIDPCNGKPYVYDIASDTEEAIPCPFQKCTWFVPGLC